MNPYFNVGDLLIDKVAIPVIIGIIEKIISNEKQTGKIIYEIRTPGGKLFWNEEFIIDGLMDGSTKVQRRIRN